MPKWQWIVFISFFSGIVCAQNTPCSGKKGGVSHCQDGKFVCTDGSISQSKYTCTPAAQTENNKN
jgi:hypothetical protein